MEKLIVELCEILEVNDLPMDVRFDELVEWDSLSALSIIALLDSNYGLSIDNAFFQKFGSILEFIQYVLDKNK